MSIGKVDFLVLFVVVAVTLTAVGSASAQWTKTGTVVHLSVQTDTVGIGTSSPNQQLEITGNLRLPTTTSTTGIIYAGSGRFIYNYGSENIFVGEYAGNLTMTGVGQNTVMGNAAFQANTTGYCNSVIGYSALSSNTTGHYNSALGSYALNNNTTGSYNLAIGDRSLQSASGNRNLALGHRSFYSHTTGNNNTALGYTAGYSNQTGSGNIFIGKEAGYYEMGSDKLYIDNSSTSSPLIYGDFDNAILALNGSVGIGTSSPNEQLEITGSLRLPETTASTNGIIWIGANSFIHTFGTDNTFVGENAGNLVMSGNSNSAMGLNALNSNTTGSSNSVMGRYVLYANTTGSSNSAIGVYALRYNTTGSSNLAMGPYALYSNATGSSNAAIGVQALRFNSTGSNNAALGASAGYNNQTGEGNVFLGKQAGYNEMGSDRLYIDNSNTSTPLIYGEFDNDILAINGSVGIGTSQPGAKLQVGDSLGTFSDNRIAIGGSTGFPGITFGEETANRGWVVWNRDDDDIQIGSNVGGVSFGDTIVLDSGSVGIGKTTPATTLDVDGVVTATGGTSTNWNTAYSERREWDGSSANLNAATGLTSLGLDNVQNVNVQTSWLQNASQYIGSEEIRARDGSGLKLYDDGGNGLFVEDGGQVGIGLVDPSRALHLQGHNAVFRMDRDVNTAGFFFVRTAPGDFNTIWKTYHVGGRASGVDTGEFIIDDLGTEVSGDGTRLLTINNSGNWAIGPQSPTEKLDVQGNVIADDYFYHSSRELKRDITPLSPADCARMLDKVEAIEVCRYRYKAGGEAAPLKLGMIAEDAPEEIRSSDGRSIRMADTVGMLMAGMKAQSELIKAQSDEMKYLKLRLDRLEKR
jgi:Chaperone of endosialidase